MAVPVIRADQQRSATRGYGGLVTGESLRRWNIGRDAVAGALLAGALLLPWNLYFGLGIPDSSAPVFSALAPATLLCLGSIAATYTGPRRMFGAHADPARIDRLRLGFAVPYLLLVFGFVVFDVVQTLRYAGSTVVPDGVGPGGWLGVAGAVLAAQPVLTDTAAADNRLPPWLRSARMLAYASIAGAGLSVLFNLYWRISYALSGSDGAAGLGRHQIAVIATALVYAVVAWLAVIVASRWSLQRDLAPRIAACALGASVLIAGPLLWILPIGRAIDGFHGVAQNTSTAGVGFEGYLAWAATAAIFAVPTLHGAPPTSSAHRDTWLTAARKLLLLIIVWSLGSAVLRSTDLLVAATLGLRYSPYDSAAMAAFDLVTAVVAVWLRINLTNRSLPLAVLWSMCAVLFGLTVSRVVVGVGLAPRLADSQRAAALSNPVYGNGFAQQITSTFDVVLCGLALCVLAIAIIAAPTQRFAATAKATPAAGRDPSPPRIFRSHEPTGRPAATAPKIYRGEDDSSQRERHEG